MRLAEVRNGSGAVDCAVEDTELSTVVECVVVLESRWSIRRIVDQRNWNLLVRWEHVVSSEIKEKLVWSRDLSESSSLISRFRASIGIGCGVSIPGASLTNSWGAVVRDSVGIDSARGNSQASKDKDSSLHGINFENFDYFFFIFCLLFLIFFMK